MPGWWYPTSASLQPMPGHGGRDEGHRAGTLPCQDVRGEQRPGHGQLSLGWLLQRDLRLQPGGVTALGPVGSLTRRGDGEDLEGDCRQERE